MGLTFLGVAAPGFDAAAQEPASPAPISEAREPAGWTTSGIAVGVVAPPILTVSWRRLQASPTGFGWHVGVVTAPQTVLAATGVLAVETGPLITVPLTGGALVLSATAGVVGAAGVWGFGALPLLGFGADLIVNTGGDMAFRASYGHRTPTGQGGGWIRHLEVGVTSAIGSR